MSEEKDGLKSIKVYKFNIMKERWHEFALKFRVIADDRGYDDIIEGIVMPLDEKEDLKQKKRRLKWKSSWQELQTKKGSETW